MTTFEKGKMNGPYGSQSIIAMVDILKKYMIDNVSV